jgi:hypothetical protein
MIKKILITGYIILATSLTAHPTDKWTGPTSPIDPMWGLTGSSLMSEALRTPSISERFAASQRDSDLQDAYEQGKRDGGKKADKYDSFGELR